MAGMDELETWLFFRRQLLQMQFCVVSSLCSCLTSLQKHCGTVSGPKAKEHTFQQKLVASILSQITEFVTQTKPKGIRKCAFPSSVLLFFQQQNSHYATVSSTELKQNEI